MRPAQGVLMLHKSLLIVVLSLLFISTGWAETALGLYESEVTVENQSAELRREAIREALEEVLDKVANADEITFTKNTLNQALKRAEHYVQQYRYTDQGLWVRFDSQAVEQLLQQSQNSSTLSTQEILLKVTGIRSLPDYIQVANYLASLKFLFSAQPRVVAPDSTLFQIKARNGQAAVAQAIDRDRFLQRTDGDSPILSFHYSP